MALFNELVSSLDDNDATTDKILDLGRNIKYDSPLGKLKTSIYHYGYKTKISDFLTLLT